VEYHTYLVKRGHSHLRLMGGTVFTVEMKPKPSKRHMPTTQVEAGINYPIGTTIERMMITIERIYILHGEDVPTRPETKNDEQKKQKSKKKDAHE